jgi:hypothetical protein
MKSHWVKLRKGIRRLEDFFNWAKGWCRSCRSTGRTEERMTEQVLSGSYEVVKKEVVRVLLDGHEKARQAV